jgi:hypothetical protein
MSSQFKKYLAVVEVGVHESRLKELEEWKVEPEDYVKTQIGEHLKDRGMMVRSLVIEAFPDAFESVNMKVMQLEGQAIMADLEEEILNTKMCVGGNCED